MPNILHMPKTRDDAVKERVELCVRLAEELSGGNQPLTAEIFIVLYQELSR